MIKYISILFQRILLSMVLPIIITGCANINNSPKLSSWEEQLNQSKHALGKEGEVYILVGASALPVPMDKRTVSGEIELNVSLVYKYPIPKQVNNQGIQEFSVRLVEYNDYYLSSTISVGEEVLSQSPVKYPISPENMKIGPHEALQLTIEKGEEFIGGEVDEGNIFIRLLGLDNPPEELMELWMSNENIINHLVWEIEYDKKESKLIEWIDSHTGTIVRELIREYNK
jgi:hypothetical protein